MWKFEVPREILIQKTSSKNVLEENRRFSFASMGAALKSMMSRGRDDEALDNKRSQSKMTNVKIKRK